MKKTLALFVAVIMLLSTIISTTSCRKKEEAGPEVLLDARVRRALSLAVDRDYINQTVWGGSRLSAFALVPKGVMDAVPGSDFRTVGGDLMTADYEAALTEAKALLKEAGFPDGKNFPELELSYATNTTHQQIAEAIQAMWKETLGITIRLTSMEWNAFMEYMQGGEAHLSSAVWVADYADASSFFDMFVSDSGYNAGKYLNPDYDSLVRQAKFLADGAERARLYHEAEEILMQDMGMIPVVFYADDVLIQTEYSGYGLAPTGNKYLWAVNQTDTTVCVGPQPSTLDPNLNASVDGMIYITHLFEGLFRPNIDGTFELGQAAEVKKEGNTYTIILRDDIFWSDGEPVTAFDFEYSWKRLCNPTTAAPFSYIGADFFANGWDVLMASEEPEALSVRALDDKTLEFEAAAEFSFDDEMLSFPNLMPLRRDIVEKSPEGWSANPETLIGNGRYRIESFLNEDRIVIRKNEDYWDAASTNAERITFKLMSDDNAILAAFKNKELDLADSFPSNERSALESTEEFHQIGNLGLYYLIINMAENAGEE